MLKPEEISYIRKKLEESTKPLFFFDDDPDGVSSFLQMYKFAGEGKGICVKGKPILEEKYARKVQEYSPDIVFVLDKPLMEQEFANAVSQEIIWLDHHAVQDIKGVKYFNPRKNDDSDNRPTSYWAYLITKSDDEDVKSDMLWIAMIGIVGDWNLLLADKFRKKYPYLLPKKIKKPEQALFDSKLGELVQIVDFNLKGGTSDVMKSIKVLSRIQDPYEILEQTSPKGKYLYKKYMTIKTKYEEIKQQLNIDKKDKFIIFKYKDNSLAISATLSNELLYRYPDKIIIIAREKQNEIMMSFRSSKQVIVNNLKEALKVTTGYGGGHDHACGGCIKVHEFDDFIQAFKKTFE